MLSYIITYFSFCPVFFLYFLIFLKDFGLSRKIHSPGNHSTGCCFIYFFSVIFTFTPLSVPSVDFAVIVTVTVSAPQCITAVFILWNCIRRFYRRYPRNQSIWQKKRLRCLANAAAAFLKHDLNQNPLLFHHRFLFWRFIIFNHANPCPICFFLRFRLRFCIFAILDRKSVV